MAINAEQNLRRSASKWASCKSLTLNGSRVKTRSSGAKPR